MSSPDATPEELQTARFTFPEGSDPQLQGIIALANEGVSQGVTVFLPWGVATGFAISSPDYAAGSAELYRTSGGDPDSQEVANLIADGLVRVGDTEAGLGQYLHLRDVRCVVGGRLMARERLRISAAAVSSWDYGITPPEQLGFLNV